MITVETARTLREAMERAEVAWTPTPGDRFLVPDRGFEEPFIVSEMVIEVRDLPSGRLIRFNGTTEWALDSVPADDVLWIPWEHQLRALLGDRFAAMEKVPGEVEGYAVALTDGSRHVDVGSQGIHSHEEQTCWSRPHEVGRVQRVAVCEHARGGSATRDVRRQPRATFFAHAA